MNVNLGLKNNWKQFTLLVIINGFVGGMDEDLFFTEKNGKD